MPAGRRRSGPPDETLIRALARAHRWQRLFEKGTYRSVAEIADAEGVTRSFVNRMMRLTLLAPDIVEAILEGRRPKGLLLEASTGQPANWPKPKASSPACCGSPSGAAYRRGDPRGQRRKGVVLDVSEN